VGSASTGLNEAGGKRKVGNMEQDALLVQKEALEEILASVNRRSHSGARTLLETMLNLCPTVNRQAASAAEHLVDALEGLTEGLNQDDYDTWFLHRDAESFINAAELALVMAYGDAGRGGIGTSVAHQLKDANAAVAISHEQIEEMFSLLRDVRTAINRCRLSLSGSEILTKCFNRIFAEVEEKVEAKLCLEEQKGG
jgi:hypothetical protein